MEAGSHAQEKMKKFPCIASGLLATRWLIFARDQKMRAGGMNNESREGDMGDAAMRRPASAGDEICVSSRNGAISVAL